MNNMITYEGGELERDLDEAREEAWRFANNCYLVPDPTYKEWLDQETRYPHGMTYKQAKESFDRFKEEKRMSHGIVIWGVDLPAGTSCYDCPCFDGEYDNCNALGEYIENMDEFKTKRCPLQAISKEDLKEK